MAGRDFGRELESDVQTFRRLQARDVSVPEAFEYTFWFLALLSVIGMVAVLPWVGESKPIPGLMWLGYSLVGILLFSSLAVIMRVVFSRFGRAADETVRSRVGGGR